MWVQWLSRALLLAAATCLLMFAYAYGEPRLRAAQTAAAFAATVAPTADPGSAPRAEDQARQPRLQRPAPSLDIPRPVTELWSASRIEAFQSSATKAMPMGVLSMARLGLQAPIYRGADTQVLDRGIGWIEGTSGLQGGGNIGLAAHRDGFFRSLKDVRIGDAITLQSASGVQHYQVSGTAIVDPADTYVLEPTHGATLTLVTCYPFYFVGDAPQRFVVFATASLPTTEL